jgi:hypothetical protein
MSESTYTKDHTEELDAELDRAFANPIGASVASPEKKVVALLALIATMEAALKIAMEHHYSNKPEPYPGACREVMRQTLHAVEISRRAKLIPERT